MTYLPEIEQQMKKILQTLQNNRSLLKYPKTSGFEDTTINVENLGDVAGNHLFDDHPEAFGISEIDGHKIRAYFQEGCTNYNFVADLHEKFKNMLEPERSEYLNRVNKIRAKMGLGPISIENEMIEIFANPDGSIAYKVISTGKIFELEYTGINVVGPEGYINITEGMHMTIPVGREDAWTVDILTSKNGDLVLFIEILDVYIKAEKIPVSSDYLKGFESKGVVNLSEKMLEAGRIWGY